MNKKRWTRILIVIVAGLWAYNIYRTVENYQVKHESQNEQINTNLSFAPVMFNKDTFMLDLPLEDPFLRNEKRWHQSSSNSSTSSSSNPNSRNQQRPTSLPRVDKKLEWPTIKYFGFIRNRDADHQLCMLNIANKNYRLSIGDSKDQISLIQAYPDSVLVSFQNEFKTIPK